MTSLKLLKAGAKAIVDACTHMGQSKMVALAVSNKATLNGLSYQLRAVHLGSVV